MVFFSMTTLGGSDWYFYSKFTYLSENSRFFSRFTTSVFGRNSVILGVILGSFLGLPGPSSGGQNRVKRGLFLGGGRGGLLGSKGGAPPPSKKYIFPAKPEFRGKFPPRGKFPEFCPPGSRGKYTSLLP